MPEIKNTFIQGKMNKDLDERLVPNGQYRDAMNIQVSTSEDSDVGTVQNILGNKSLFDNPNSEIPLGSVCVGVIADEKNDCFYWFTYHTAKSLILKYTKAGVSFVFVDTESVLEFTGKIITGINIIDDLLFWTDNLYEPKKINVKLCEEGTDQSGSNHTNLIVPQRNINNASSIKVQKEHITVIKKSPKTKLTLDPVFEEKITSTATFDFDEDNDDELMVVGETDEIEFENFSPISLSYSVDDEILLLNNTSPATLPESYDVKIKLIEEVGVNIFRFKIITIADGTSKNAIDYNCVKQSSELIFSRKFVRFGYRYKFTDGEYSPFSSFTDSLFKPGDFEYNSLKAYNIAMENNLVSLKLRNFFNKETPQDVVQVDILYKESNSPIVYIVDKIKYDDPKTVSVGVSLGDRELINYWHANLYEIKRDLIYAVVSENQLLRPWDNVPRKALAQEITGNRIVYANYLQNYNLNIKPVLRGDYVSRYTNNTTFKVDYTGNLTDLSVPIEEEIILGFGQKSLKSLRNYQLGITYLDKYNRETPVFTSVESSFSVPKKHAAYKTKIQGKILTDPPSWAESFKVYIKETSTEYYNLAMSRVYRAEDGNLWLAFPSSERNKVDEETFLILKKAVDENKLIKEEAKYKILAIENEAPDYIKTEVKALCEIDCGGNTNAQAVFVNNNSPQVDVRSFDILTEEVENANIFDLNLITDSLFIDFRDVNNTYTTRYEIESINKDIGGNFYNIVLSETFRLSDAEFIYSNYPDDTTTTSIETLSKLKLTIYKSKIVEKPEFKGVFFVKINSDEVSEEHVIPASDGIPNYEVENNLFTHYFSDTAAISSGTGTTQVSNSGVSSTFSVGRTNSKDEWKALLDYGGSDNDLFTSVSGTIGGFFIDQACYVGIHPQGSADNQDTDDLSHVRYTRNIDSTGNDVEFGKGIYKENGKHYVELSYSKIGENATTGTGIVDEVGRFTLNFANFNNSEIWEPGDNEAALNDYTANYGGQANELRQITNKIAKGNKFRIKNDDDQDNIYTIKDVEKIKRYNHTNYEDLHDAWENFLFAGGTNNAYDNELRPTWNSFGRAHNRRITYKIELDHSLDEVKIGSNNFLDTTNNINEKKAVSIQFLKKKTNENVKQIVSKNPAIWETEPKETIDLDIYYGASEAIPIEINSDNNERFIPKGSVVSCPARPKTMGSGITFVKKWVDNKIVFNQSIDLDEYQPPFKPPVRLIFTRPDDSYTTIRIDVPATIAAIADGTISVGTAYYIVKTNVSSNPFALSWFNCFSFNNGVESNRIRDDFNQPIISKGAKASTVLEENYEEERRKNGLIYSGIYNSNSGINNLNQFIQAEKITKDINPIHGSIQKLHSRNTDLVTLCEDKCLKILVQKDALFNAGGNMQLLAKKGVLGQTIPFSGEFGISKNPESFASESYRVYFTDKQRGAVIRLSMDGLTPISEYGMSDYFKDNLKLAVNIIGSYDDKKNEYNLTLKDRDKLNTTVSFKESVTGWTSFKSFVPDQGLSMANDYYTIKDSLPYQHHVEQFDIDSGKEINRNTFYGTYTNSSVDVLLNETPGSIKSFKTLNYEGSQSYINQEITDVRTGYYNLVNKDGWSAVSIETDKQKGSVVEFIEKEGKWFNYIKGNDVSQTLDIKTDEFSFQGIGRVSDVVEIDPDLTITAI